MRKVLFMTGLMSLLASLCGCSSEPRAELLRKPEGKILTVCYSESANQNTMTAAKWIQQQVGGDLCVIKMVTPYSDSYRKVLKESKHHLDNDIKPEILPLDKNVADYDVIFVGSPVWYGTFAPPLGTFFSKHDLSGKTVIPFCTHGGGGAGHLFEDVAKAAPKSKVLPGLTLKGSAKPPLQEVAYAYNRNRFRVESDNCSAYETDSTLLFIENAPVRLLVVNAELSG